MTDIQNRIAHLSPAQRERLEVELSRRAEPGPAKVIRPRDPDRVVPLSFQQEREWAISQFRPVNSIPSVFRVHGLLDPELVDRALTDVVARHEVLRSTVQLARDGSLTQTVHPASPVQAGRTDLSDRPAAEQDEHIRQLLAIEVSRAFGPDEPVRLRMMLSRLSATEHVVVITSDHISGDLLSGVIIVAELAQLYAHHRDHTDALPAPELQYGDFAVWQRDVGAERLTAELAHWREVLVDLSGVLPLPADRPFPARPDYAGGSHLVDVPFADGLRGLAEERRTSLSALLLTAGAILLHRYLDAEDVVVGELVSGRHQPGLERMLGCFVAALPLRLRLRGDQSLAEVIDTAKNVVLTAHEHQDLPIERLIGELELGHEASRTSLSQLWLDVRMPETTVAVRGLQVEVEPVSFAMATAPLTVHAYRDGAELRLRWAYMTEMFDPDTVELLSDQFSIILRTMVEAQQTRVADVPLTPADASGAAATSGRRTSEHSTPVTGAGSVLELIQSQVQADGDKPAVICDGVAVSYTELDRDARALAHRLRAAGVGPDTRVGVLAERTPFLPVAILGVLWAGGCYVPIDPGYPPERIRFLLEDSGAGLLVSHQHALLTADRDRQLTGEDGHVELLLLDGPDGVLEQAASDAAGPLPLPDAEMLAYVVYTSGSTGRPKGAMIRHGSLARFSVDVWDRLGLTASDRFLQFASPSFDVLAEELFPTWAAGGAVVIATQHIMSGGADLLDVLAEERLTVMELPTAYWHEWVRDLDRRNRVLPDSLRLVIIGGERVLPDRLARWRRHGVPLFHVYGLTETTVSSTFFALDPGDPDHDWPNLPIGSPLPSVELKLLDRQLRPTPLGGTGELYIGGGSLARGYLDRPSLTAQRFVADPDGSGERLYRTGDLLRQRADATLEFLTRADTQVKIRGFRVEPTEIESTLIRHETVAQAVVTAYEPVPGDRRLVAYVVPEAGSTPNVGQLRRYLEQELPLFMMPSAFVDLPELPLTGNGKVDHARLPSADTGRLNSGRSYVAPQSPLEEHLAEVLAEVLGLERVGLRDNFFDLGGDSILAIQVVARAQERGIRLSPYDLFAHPSIAGLSEVAVLGTGVDAQQGEVTGPVPLAPSQRRYTAARGQDGAGQHLSLLIRLTTPVSPDHLREAVDAVIVHHDGLRQRFLLAGERSRVRIAPSGDLTPFEVLDLSGVPTDERPGREADLFERLRDGLDVALGPLMRVGLIRIDVGDPGRLAVVVHRLVADPASLSILLADLATSSTQLAEGRPLRLPAKTSSWQAWARRLADRSVREQVADQRSYWQQLVGGAAGRLPVSAGEGRAEAVIRLSPQQAADLAGCCTELGVEVDELMLTALTRTLAATTGEQRHVVLVERDDRAATFDDLDVSRTVGRFVRTFPVAVGTEPDEPPEASLDRVKEQLRSAPMGGLGWALLPSDSAPLPPVPADVTFNGLDGARPAVAESFGTELGRLDPETAGAIWPSPVAVQMRRNGSGLELHWTATGLDPEVLQLLAERLAEQTAALVALDPEQVGRVRTPTDVPLARVDQARLDDLLERL